ncbi:MAG: hypothetical protein IIC82_06315 [Chloroflexi bacterium]|nr:hypothetical protein [Chloroflexota bacterium]
MGCAAWGDYTGSGFRDPPLRGSSGGGLNWILQGSPMPDMSYEPPARRYTMSSINFNPSLMLLSQRNLRVNTLAQNNSLHKLSTGLRINKAKDDPAGLISSESLRAILKALEAEGDPDNEAVQGIMRLMQAVDDYIPLPERPKDLPFLMPIEDVFGIKGRGTVVTGRVERGVVKPSDEIEIVGYGETRKTVVTGVEMFHKLLDEAEPGDAVGCLLRGVDREDVERGQVLAKPGTMKPSTKAEGQVYVLSKEEGGRHTPFFSGYKPQFYIRTTDVTGEITLPEGVEMVMPGDNIVMGITLQTPVALENELRFAIREGGRTVGSGVITKVL